MIKLTGRVTPIKLSGRINMVPSDSSGGPLQSKTVSPRHEPFVVVPDEDYYGLIAVNVRAVPKIPVCASRVVHDEANIHGTKVALWAESGLGVLKPFTYHAECFETTSGTSLTGEISAEAGDWILATVTTRSETTLPEEWTVLRQSYVLTDSNSGLNQRLSLLCKKADKAGSVECTVQQASAGRIYLNLISFTDIGGFEYWNGTEFYKNNDSNFNGSVYAYNPSYIGRVWACTAPLWATSTPYGTWTTSGLTPICLDDSVTQPRQANFVEEIGSTSGGRTFVCSSGDTTSGYIIDCVNIIELKE